MSRSRSHRCHLRVEVMEDRLTPTTGIPWLDPGNLTLSFVPDGTDVSGKPSNLFSLLGASAPTDWQREVLRAFQTWAAQTNLNIGLVPDGGLPMGAPGAVQGDTRFGDFRVAARPLSASQNDSLAGTTGFEPGGGTWAGDAVLNNRFQFAAGSPTGSQHDLYSVMLHEAGNALGLKDNKNDPTAVMWGKYKARTGLSASDVSAIQGLYGVRVNDPYEGASGNEYLSAAYDLSQNGQLTHLSADVTRAGDVDVYRFTTPDQASGATSLTADLRAAGVSLLTARVTVYDAQLNPVGTAVATDPLANNLSIPVANYQPSATYYVRVEGAGSDVFSVGAYTLRLSYDVPVGTSNVKLGVPSVNFESQPNETFDTATPLTQQASVNTPTFGVAGSLVTGDADWYRVTPQWSATGTGTLTVSVWPATHKGVMPVLRVYDSAGQLLGADVVANEKGTYTVQLPNQHAGQTYAVQVQAANPTGPRSTGAYVLGANLAPVAPIKFDALSGRTLTAEKPVLYSKLTVKETRLTQFALRADAGGSATEAAVRMTVFDSDGKAVFTVVAHAGRGVATGNVWLPAGTYTVAFNAATRTGAPLPDLTFELRKRERSDPIDPYLNDPTLDPTGTGTPVVTTSPPAPLPPPGTVIEEPISDPYDDI
jgi:hypothetical protein